jgi:peptidoglycan/LPS O-acetylase OafA/YrhL
MSVSQPSPKPHSMRQRKLIGTVLLLVFLAVYALLAMVVAMMLQMQSANKIVELIYYVVAGLLWTIPAGLLIRWMSRDDGDPRNRPVV